MASSSYCFRPPEGAEKGPRETQRLRARSRPSAGYALPFGHAYRRGGYRLTPALPGLRAPASGKRPPKPRALSGRGGVLGFGLAISFNCL